MRTHNVRINIRVPENLIKALKDLGFNISEVCRQAMEEKLKKTKKAS